MRPLSINSVNWFRRYRKFCGFSKRHLAENFRIFFFSFLHKHFSQLPISVLCLLSSTKLALSIFNLRKSSKNKIRGRWGFAVSGAVTLHILYLVSKSFFFRSLYCTHKYRNQFSCQTFIIYGILK